MAKRRMFSKDVVQSARFLKLPAPARLLYYDLGMAADDDGVVEAFTVLRTTGAAQEDLELLEQRGFVQVLNEDAVSFITHWKRNNYIQNDRYTPSIYKKLIPSLEESRPDTPAVQSVSNLDTQDRLGQDSKGQSSLIQYRIGKGRAAAPAQEPSQIQLPYPPTEKDVLDYAKAKGLEVDCWKFYQYYRDRDWKQNNGRPLHRWGLRLERWAQYEYNRPGWQAGEESVSPAAPVPAGEPPVPEAERLSQAEDAQMRRLMERLREAPEGEETGQHPLRPLGAPSPPLGSTLSAPFGAPLPEGEARGWLVAGRF